MTDPRFQGRTIGIVGAGAQAMTMHLPFFRAVGMEPTWILDASERNARAAATAYDIPVTLRPDELEKITPTDIVLIGCPYGARKPYYEFFRQHAAALYLEKPVARSLREHRDLSALRPDYAIAVGFLRRSSGMIGIVKGLVQDNVFGALRHVRSEFGGATQISSGNSFAKDLSLAGGGQLLESAIHDIDTICYIAGATSAHVLQKRMVHEGGFDLHTEARIELRGERLPPLEWELLVTCFRHTSYEIQLTFDNAVLTFSPSRNLPPQIKAPQGTTTYRVADAFADDYPRSQYDVHYVFWRDFLRGVDERSANYTSLRTSIATTDIIEQLYRE